MGLDKGAGRTVSSLGLVWPSSVSNWGGGAYAPGEGEGEKVGRWA